MHQLVGGSFSHCLLPYTMCTCWQQRWHGGPLGADIAQCVERGQGQQEGRQHVVPDDPRVLGVQHQPHRHRQQHPDQVCVCPRRCLWLVTCDWSISETQASHWSAPLTSGSPLTLGPHETGQRRVSTCAQEPGQEVRLWPLEAGHWAPGLPPEALQRRVISW